MKKKTTKGPPDTRKDFFLNYANHSLLEDPKCLRSLIADIVVPTYTHVEEDPDCYEDLCEAVIMLAEGKKDYSTAKPSRKKSHASSFGIEDFVKLMNGEPWYRIPNYLRLIDRFIRSHKGFPTKGNMIYFWEIYRMASQTIYGQDCNTCDWAEMRGALLGRDQFANIQKLKCYECDRLHFCEILNGIIKGKEYGSIHGFEDFLAYCNDSMKVTRAIDIVDNVSTKDKEVKVFKTTLRNAESVAFPLRRDDIRDPIKYLGEIDPFRQRIIGVAIYSLSEFLINNDRRKLKKCEWCERYYTTKRIIKKQKYCPECSAKNKMSTEGRTIYQRKYRGIQRLTKDLGISGEEAEKIMEKCKLTNLRQIAKFISLRKSVK